VEAVAGAALVTAGRPVLLAGTAEKT